MNGRKNCRMFVMMHKQLYELFGPYDGEKISDQSEETWSAFQ